MKHYTFGYARVSTEQQNLDRQLDMLNKYGVDKIYTEKMTGTKRDRPELNLHVWSMWWMFFYAHKCFCRFNQHLYLIGYHLS